MFVLADNFLPLAVILGFIAVIKVWIRRFACVTIISLLCFASEWYFFHSVPSSRPSHSNFKRLFFANFPTPFLAVTVLLGLLMVMLLGITSLLIFQRRERQRAANQDREAGSAGSPMPPGQEELDHPHVKLLTSVSLLFLPLSFVSGFFGMDFSSIPWNTAPYQELPAHLLRYWFPQTTSRFQDLDQSVTIFADFTVLGFTLYAIAAGWYQASLKEDENDHRRRHHNFTRLSQQDYMQRRADPDAYEPRTLQRDGQP